MFDYINTHRGCVCLTMWGQGHELRKRNEDQCDIAKRNRICAFWCRYIVTTATNTGKSTISVGPLGRQTTSPSFCSSGCKYLFW